MRELWGPFLFGVGLFSLLIISTAVLQDALKFITRYNQPPSVFFTLVGYAMPEFIVLSIPMGVLLGTLLSVGRLNTDNEIIAIRACGLSLYRVLAPYFVVGILMSCLTFLGNEIVVPYCNTRALELKESIVFGKRGLGKQQRFDWPIYTRDTPPHLEWVLIAGEVEDDTLEDVDLFYFDAENKINNFHIEADRAVWRGRTWFFYNGRQIMLHQRKSEEEQPSQSSENQPQETPDQQLDDSGNIALKGPANEPQYCPECGMPIAESQEQVEQLIVGFEEIQTPDFSIMPETLRLRKKTAEDLNMVQLAQVIKGKILEGLPPNDQKILDLRTSLHFKVSIPLTPLFFIIVALPMAIMPQRSSRAMGMGLALLTVLAYYSLFVVFQKVGVAGYLPPAVAAWIPNSILFITGVVLLQLREQN